MVTISKSFEPKFVMTEGNVQDAIAVEPYGAIAYPTPTASKTVTLKALIGDKEYTASVDLNEIAEGSTITFSGALS